MDNAIPPRQIAAMRTFSSAYGRLVTEAARAIEHARLNPQLVGAALEGRDFPRPRQLRDITALRQRAAQNVKMARNEGITREALHGRALAIHLSVQEEWELQLPAPAV